MNSHELVSLGWKHAVNALAEEMYINIGMDWTKPVAFYGLVNERCNAQCRYCEYWRLPEYKPELAIDEWKAALLSIKDFVGAFSISFSGGEPMMKAGFLDLFAWCHFQGIKAGVTTNGSLLTAACAARVVAAHPFNVNISLDAPKAEIHDHLRGAPGLFERVSQGIGFLREERRRQNIDFPIMLKPTITERNFRYLPELVEWAQAREVMVSPQPVDRWTRETYNELWIERERLSEFEIIVEKLIEMQKSGAPIVTPEAVLRLMPDHYRELAAPHSVMPCRVGLRNFFIRANGDVEACVMGYPPIGNVKRQSARQIWQSARAREVRHETVHCEKLCLTTCLSQKTLGNKVGMGLRLMKSAS